MSRGRVEIEDGVVYGRAGGDGRELRCDVFRPDEDARRSGVPDADAPAPAVLLIHGGGWRTGDRTQLRGYGVLIGREGYVCVAPEYRLLDEAPWPACLEDVQACLAWMVEHADDLGIDPERIAVEGNSAGAHLALLLAADDDQPTKACIAVYPPVLLAHIDPSGEGAAPTAEAIPLFALADDGGSVELESAVSPLRLVGDHWPPTALFHGSTDELVPVHASFALYDALAEHGVPCDLHIYADQPHAFDAGAAYGRTLAREMITFLDARL